MQLRPLVYPVAYTNATAMPADLGGLDAGTTFSNDTLESIFDRLFYPYVPPSVTLAASPLTTLREFGDDVVNPTLTATPVAGSDPITSIEFKRGAVVIQDTPSDPDVTDIFTVDTNTTYTVTVDDGTSTDFDTQTYSFVYPFYYGVGAQGLTAAQVAALTKLIQTNGDKVLSFAPTNQVYYFAFPQAYGQLTRVLDWNGFDITADFTIRAENITGLDGTAQPYYIYEFDNLVTHSAQNLTFDT